MGRLDGTVSISDLPPHKGLIINLHFFEVNGPDASAPYGGDPPEASTDCQQIVEQVDFKEESEQTTFEQPFSIEHRAGYYYVQVGVILFRDRGGSVFAQVEHFFFSRRPLEIASKSLGHIALPVCWPAIPLADLHTYGTVAPQSPKFESSSTTVSRRPWWKVW